MLIDPDCSLNAAAICGLSWFGLLVQRHPVSYFVDYILVLFSTCRLCLTCFSVYTCVSFVHCALLCFRFTLLVHLCHQCVPSASFFYTSFSVSVFVLYQFSDLSIPSSFVAASFLFFFFFWITALLSFLFVFLCLGVCMLWKALVTEALLFVLFTFERVITFQSNYVTVYINRFIIITLTISGSD